MTLSIRTGANTSSSSLSSPTRGVSLHHIAIALGGFAYAKHTAITLPSVTTAHSPYATAPWHCPLPLSDCPVTLRLCLKWLLTPPSKLLPYVDARPTALPLVAAPTGP